jgi:hypothetical protein
MLLGLGCAAVGAVFGSGYAAYAQIDSRAEAANRPLAARVEAVEARQVASDASVTESNRRVANIERVVMTIDLNQRLMLESRGLTPIDVPHEPRDGGR